MKALPITSSHVMAPALLAASIAIFALPAGAVTIIPVTNHSFETNKPADGIVDPAVAGWTKFTSVGTGGTFNPNNTWFSGTTGSGTATGADGINILTTNAATTGSYAGVYQTLTGTTLTAGVTYTMTVAIGDYANQNPTRMHLAISTSSMALGSYLAHFAPTNGETLVTNDAFTDFSVQYTATGFETQIGQDLKITIWGQNHGSGTHLAFDNVRVTSIPEPSTALLGGLGMLLLLRRRNR